MSVQTVNGVTVETVNGVIPLTVSTLTNYNTTVLDHNVTWKIMLQDYIITTAPS